MSGNEIAVSLRIEPGTPVYRAENTARAWARSQGLEPLRMEVHPGGIVTITAQQQDTHRNEAGQ